MGETLVPRFGIRTQIVFLSIVLVFIPFIGKGYWQDLRETVLSAQSRIQESEAKVIATTLLATQKNIRQLLAANENSELQKHALNAPLIKKPIRMDGVLSDVAGMVAGAYAIYTWVKLAMALLTACDDNEMDMGLQSIIRLALQELSA